jgi:hypothetical protein
MGSDHAGVWSTYQHILESAVNPPPQLSHFIIANDARERWIQQFLEVSPQVPPELTSLAELEEEAHRITDDIENTSLLVFKTQKGYSPRGAVWWNNECDIAAARVQEAQDPEMRKATNKALRKTVATAKRAWANDFLHEATPE